MSLNSLKSLHKKKHVVPAKPTTPVVVGAANPQMPWQSRRGKKPIDAAQTGRQVGKPILVVSEDATGELPTDVFKRSGGQ